MLDFGLLPPEVNSGRMYSGPGPGPLLAAAEAWDSLASDLGIASAGYGSTLSELTSGSWTGPTSSAMMAAVTPYVDWLSTTAAQAEQTANQARAAVAAYEAAFAMTVPPPAIAANRALLMALVATNFFGQNTAAIMATEALYVEMWAQDAAAMYSYLAASAAAAVVTPFVAPAQTANQDGVNNQADAVAKAAATPASQAATVAQNAAATVPTTSAQTTTATGTTATSGATTVAVPAVPTTFVQWIQTLTYNTITQFGQGGWGLGLSSGNLNSMRQILQAYFAVGLGNFGYGLGQQTITPAQAMGLEQGLGLMPATPNSRAALPPGHWRHHTCQRRTVWARCRPAWARPALPGGCRCPRVGQGRRPRRWKRPSWSAPHARSHRRRMGCSTVFRWRATPVLEPVSDAAAAATP